jgi:hypothetical protein
LSRRTTRLLAAALGCAALAVVLTACDKPTPSITVYNGRTAIKVNSAKYCFDGNANTCRSSNAAGKISVTPGSTIVVDVPRQIASNHWAVTSLVKQSDGTITTIDASSSPVVSNTHSVRITVPQATSGGYQIAVQSFTGTKATGEWDVEVTLTTSSA